MTGTDTPRAMYNGIAIRAMTAASWFCTSLRISPLGASAALSHLRKRPGAICLGTRPAMTPTGASGAMIITATGARAAMSAMAIGAATATMTAAVTIKAVHPGMKTAPSAEWRKGHRPVPRGPENTRASGCGCAPEGVNMCSPAFDVVVAGLMTAIVGDKGTVPREGDLGAGIPPRAKLARL